MIQKSQPKCFREIKTGIWLVVLCTVFGFCTIWTAATTVYYPKFSTPIVLRDRLVFSDVSGERLICIDRKDGHLLWEKKQKVGNFLPFRVNDKILVGGNRRLYDLDTETGELKTLFKHGFDWLREIDQDDRGYLVEGSSPFNESLALLDSRNGKIKWRVDHVDRGANISRDTILYWRDRGGADFTTIRAIDRLSGRELWSEKIQERLVEASAFTNIFVVGLVVSQKELRTYDERSGTILNRVKPDARVFHLTEISGRPGLSLWFGGSETRICELRPTLETGDVVSWGPGFHPWLWHDGIVIGYQSEPQSGAQIVFSKSTLCALDQKNMTQLWKTDWQSAEWKGVYDGTVYASVTEVTSWSTSINSLDIRTGKVVRLYWNPLQP